MEWWESLDRKKQNWTIIGGFVAMIVVGGVVGVVGATHLAVLEPLMHLGFSTVILGLIGGLVSSVVREM